MRALYQNTATKRSEENRDSPGFSSGSIVRNPGLSPFFVPEIQGCPRFSSREAVECSFLFIIRRRGMIRCTERLNYQSRLHQMWLQILIKASGDNNYEMLPNVGWRCLG